MGIDDIYNRKGKIMSIEASRAEVRKMQLEQVEYFRSQGWHEIADKMEKELERYETYCDNEDGNFERK